MQCFIYKKEKVMMGLVTVGPYNKGEGRTLLDIPAWLMHSVIREQREIAKRSLYIYPRARYLMWVFSITVAHYAGNYSYSRIRTLNLN
jgi:hypothetical protein